jgi:hypothetical protein
MSDMEMLRQQATLGVMPQPGRIAADTL